MTRGKRLLRAVATEVAKKMSGRRYGEGMTLTWGYLAKLIACVLAIFNQCLVWFLVNWISAQLPCTQTG